MIILDTNVISELMREEPHENVKVWIAAHKPASLSITTIAIAEIQRGLARLPKGKRRNTLNSNTDRALKAVLDATGYETEFILLPLKQQGNSVARSQRR